ncbi:MAG: sigma factor-like helix-turn-helix DNA-binding protein [Coprobacillaceae bacterium]
MTKERKDEIKKTLKNYKSNMELVDVYNQLISRYEDIRNEQSGVLEDWQHKELIEWKRVRLELFKKVDSLEKGINCLNVHDEEKHKEIITAIYIKRWTRVKTAQELKVSEPRISQIIEEGINRLNLFVI